MRIIFLDIDGVLNSNDYYKYRSQPDFTFDSEIYPYCNISPVHMANLNKIIEATEAKVVISSTWRHGRTLDEMREILEKVGFQGEIIDFTPDLAKFGWAVRGNEIGEWVRTNIEILGALWWKTYMDYVILDDDEDMLFQQRENFVNTSALSGLDDEATEKAIKILLNPPTPSFLGYLK